MGISIINSGDSLLDNQIWIEDSIHNHPLNKSKIISSPRVGCEYAGQDANNPWRFRIHGNPWVSPAL
jgi:DNA-3-methyladenine glycosylase